MVSISVAIVLVAVTLSSCCLIVNGYSVEECMKIDSISCLQLSIYDQARSLLDRPVVDVLGLSWKQWNGRRGKSLKDLEMEENVTKAQDVQSRQDAIESFLAERVNSLWQSRSVEWKFGKFVHDILEYVPFDLKNTITDSVEEARGRRKDLKMLMPLLVALKVKMVWFGTIALFAIAAIAKKAILAAVLSLVVSSYLGIKSMMTASHSEIAMPGPYYKTTGYHAVPAASENHHHHLAGNGHPQQPTPWHPTPTAPPTAWPAAQEDSYADQQHAGTVHHLVYAAQKPHMAPAKSS